MDPEAAHKVEEFFARYPLHHYSKGQILIHAQDNPGHILYLTQGRVKEYDISYRGDEVVLNIFKPPAFFPMSHAMNRTPNSYFFEAETDVALRKAPIDDALRFLKGNPDVLYDLLARVFRGTDGLLGRIAHLMASSAKSRVLYELLIEGRRFGTRHGSGVIVLLSESDIGARAGLARETVNREMHKLKDEGLITITKNEITINDIDELAGLISREL